MILSASCRAAADGLIGCGVVGVLSSGSSPGADAPRPQPAEEAPQLPCLVVPTKLDFTSMQVGGLAVICSACCAASLWLPVASHAVLSLLPAVSASEQRGSPCVVTVYNPYALCLSFAVLCTAPALFSVSPATGELPQQSSVRIIVKQRHSAAPQADRSSSREEQLMVEISNQDGQSVGRQIVSIACAATAARTLRAAAAADEMQEAETAAAAAASQQPQPRSDSAAAGLRSSGSGSVSSLLLLLSQCLRLFPLLVGILVVSRISSGEIELAVHDPHAQLWLCFCIGMLTMLMQVKFLEIAK